eukprot:3437561-Rhodomonas_salina.2
MQRRSALRLSSCAVPNRCPVLTQHMVLLGGGVVQDERGSENVSEAGQRRYLPACALVHSRY